MKLTDIILEKKTTIHLSYSDPGDRLYSISVNGVKQRGADLDKIIKKIEKKTKLTVPKSGSIYDTDVVNLVKALKHKGYDAAAYPMDVT